MAADAHADRAPDPDARPDPGRGTPEPDAARAGDRHRLDRIAVVGVLDAVLLVPLLLGLIGVLDTEAYVGVLGALHGAGFLLLVWLTGAGAATGRWGWWFPALTVVTGGPPGSLVGDVVLRRRLSARPGA